MTVTFFLKGLLIGVIFGLPAGAIGALTIQRTLEKGFKAGMITGLGSSAADLIYSCVGIFGISVISDFLKKYHSAIQIIGGILILFLGLSTLRKKELTLSPEGAKSTPVFCFISSFTAAIFNPATVIGFMIAFTMFGITGDMDNSQRITLASGILAGTICWWLTVCGITAYCRKKITNSVYKWLNRILGSLMILFSIVMVIKGAIGK